VVTDDTEGIVSFIGRVEVRNTQMWLVYLGRMARDDRNQNNIDDFQGRP
jgi:hypothetical protein